jgi:hypothetical protein
MNERIRELQIQAEAAADEIFDRKGKMYGEIVMEKFAELIVRECAELADDGYGSTNFGNGICGAQVLKHFGVEQ